MLESVFNFAKPELHSEDDVRVFCSLNEGAHLFLTGFPSFHSPASTVKHLLLLILKMHNKLIDILLILMIISRAVSS